MPKIANDRKLITRMAGDRELDEIVHQGLYPKFVDYKYSYNFSWLGIPIIQTPQDILAMQEIVWETRPDLIVETGVAHGGSLIFYASLMRLMGNEGRVVGVDIDIRPHNRKAIEEHPMSSAITLVQGSSVDKGTVDEVRRLADGCRNVLVVLDSNHTHEHVAKELELYSPLVGKGGYLVVMDTVVEDLDDDSFPQRPWGKGNNAKTAVWEFVEKDKRFEIDNFIADKLVITACPDGFLKCVEDLP